MDMLGHEHEADNDELVTAANLLEHGEQEVAATGGAKLWLAPMTAAGNDV